MAEHLRKKTNHGPKKSVAGLDQRGKEGVRGKVVVMLYRVVNCMDSTFPDFYQFSYLEGSAPKKISRRNRERKLPKKPVTKYNER